MTAYNVSSGDARKFSLTKNESLIGDLVYEQWFSFKSRILLVDNSGFTIEPKGFWGTTIELKDNDNVLLSFKMGWSGNIIIHSRLNNIEEDYIFKQKGLLKSTFVLTDAASQELLAMTPDFKWNKLNYDYSIATTDSFDALQSQDILLLTAVHCANYYMAMMTTAMMYTV